MTWVAVSVAGATLVGGYLSSEAMKDAANTQAAGAAGAQARLLQAGKEAAALYQPYRDIGTTALSDLTANRNYFQNQFTNKDLNATLAPGYDFRLQQGQKANLQASNLAGGGLSGNALRSLQDYSQNFASGEYANAFNQYQAQRTNIFNQLKSIADLGMTATTGSANAMLGTSTNVANISSGLSNAIAASQIAQGNIYGNVAQGVGNAAAYYAMNQNQQPQTSSQYMNSIGAGSGSGQYFGSNSNGLGAGGTPEFNSMIGLA